MPLPILGILPTVKRNQEFSDNHEKIFEIFKTINYTQPSGFLEKTNDHGITCFKGFSSDSIDFWMGMQRNSQNGKWYSLYEPSIELPNLEIKGWDNCLTNVGGIPDSDYCTKESPCGICSVSQDKVLYLKGLCKDDLTLYDNEYYIFGLKNNRPYFR